MTAGEGSTVSIQHPTVPSIVTISTQLNTVTSHLAEIRKANQELTSSLHNLSSRVANESATNKDIHPLQTALGDLSHRVTASAPTAPPTAPTAPP